MYCQKCGAQMPDDARFCKTCGNFAGPKDEFQNCFGISISNNVKGLLCYLFGWVSGLIMLLLDNDTEVRFNAIQSLIFFGVINLVGAGTIFPFPMMVFHTEGVFPMFLLSFFVHFVIGLFTFVMWIVFMVKAYQGVHFSFPIVGRIAEKYSVKRSNAQI